MTMPDRLRSFANLPSEVPEALLSEHLGIAERDLQRRSGMDNAPDGHSDIWEEAIIVRALSSVLPWLNTFALDGAAKVGRLEGTVEFRFLTPDDVAAREKALLARFDALIASLPGSAAEDMISTKDFSMSAV